MGLSDGVLETETRSADSAIVSWLAGLSKYDRLQYLHQL